MSRCEYCVRNTRTRLDLVVAGPDNLAAVVHGGHGLVAADLPHEHTPRGLQQRPSGSGNWQGGGGCAGIALRARPPVQPEC
jgi:hypothetical protein